MTDEDAFHRRLNRCPRDWQCRLVFADYLDERGDPRAEGMRALGVSRLVPFRCTSDADHRPVARREFSWVFGRDDNAGEGTAVWLNVYRACLLPVCWYRLLPGHNEAWRWWAHHASRRLAEDAAALAFAKLPAERRAELLNPQEVTQA